MKQVKVHRCQTLLEANQRAMPLNADMDSVTQRYVLVGSTTAAGVWPLDGTFSNLTVASDSNPGANVFVVTLYKVIAGVDTSTTLTVTGAGATSIFNDDTHTVSVSAGDLLWFSVTCTDPTNSLSISYTFESANDFDSAHTGGPKSFGFSPAVGWGALDSSTPGAQLGSIVGANGSITKLYGYAYTAPGLGQKVTYYITKNGVIQDGSGGTVDTRLDIVDNNHAANVAFNLPVVRGDLVIVVCVNVGLTSASDRLSYGLVFTATTAKQFNTCGARTDSFAGSPQYAWNGRSSTTEALIRGVVNSTGLVLSGMEIWGVNPFNAALDHVTYRLRQNFTNPANQPVVTVLHADNTNFGVETNAAHNNIYLSNDIVTLSADQSFNDEWHWGFLSTVPTQSIVVTKVVDPTDNPTSFSFTAGGGLSPTTFSLTNGQSETFSDIAVGSGYTVAEDPAGSLWTTTYIVSNGSPIDNIAVALGETVTITFTNTLNIPPVTHNPRVVRWRIYRFDIKIRTEEEA